MKTKILAAAVLVTAFATPAFADFWIVRDGPSGLCRIVETKPADTKIVVVGNKAYKVRDEAQSHLSRAHWMTEHGYRHLLRLAQLH
jgi:hypothetical protein